MWGYVAMAALVLIGTVTALAATEPEQSARAEAATSTETAFTRVMHAAIGAFSEFLVARTRSRHSPSWCCSNSPTRFPAP